MKSRHMKPLGERFAAFVDRRAAHECWLWTGKSRTAGYGVIGRGGRKAGKILAHRLAYELANGPIPDGEGHHGTVVRHKCDNRLCCNPDHLVLGTQADNVRDQIERGRFIRLENREGEQHPNSRFSDSDVRHIRASPSSSADLGREFGVARQVIAAIRRNVTWKHLE